MDDSHRKLILNNIDELIDNTNYEKIMDASVKNKILSPIMERNIKESTSDERMRHRKLFEKITKRGPSAYELLVQILKELKNLKAVQILQKQDEFISIKEKKSGHLNNANVIINICNSNNNINNNQNSNNIIIDNADRSEASPITEGCAQSQIDSSPMFESSLKLKVWDQEIPNKFIVKKSRKYHIDPKIEGYTMRKRNRGVLFMVNIIEFSKKVQIEPRSGADVDGESLLHLFREFGYTLFYYKNLSSKQFQTLLFELLESTYVRETESFVMVLMTHGEMENEIDRVQFVDGDILSIPGILEYFRNDTCRNLVGKPKIFFLPFCRGNISDRGTRRVQTDSIPDSIQAHTIPTTSDIFLAFGTVPGYKTHREESGSWYIQTLCDVFAEFAHTTDLEDMLKLVGQRANRIRTTDGKMQTASGYGYGFFKKLYFNPGYYEIDNASAPNLG